jgi:hypothetical protein
MASKNSGRLERLENHQTTPIPMRTTTSKNQLMEKARSHTDSDLNLNIGT